MPFRLDFQDEESDEDAIKDSNEEAIEESDEEAIEESDEDSSVANTQARSFKSLGLHEHTVKDMMLIAKLFDHNQQFSPSQPLIPNLYTRRSTFQYSSRVPPP